MPKVTIMRGIPGSGKTTWANDNLCGPHLVNRADKVSADDFFAVSTGTGYKFELEKLWEAHANCLRGFFWRLRHTPPLDVVVDNTNTRAAEIAPYYALAEAHGYDVEIVWLHIDPEAAIRRNTHGVPDNKIRLMAQSCDALPSWYKVRHVMVVPGS